MIKFTKRLNGNWVGAAEKTPTTAFTLYQVKDDYDYPQPDCWKWMIKFQSGGIVVSPEDYWCARDAADGLEEYYWDEYTMDMPHDVRELT